jgi:PBP1b-binding outer membrane lipoprotein LpoB
MKRALFVSLLLLAGCSSGPKPAENKPADKPVENPADKPSDVPALQTLKGDSVAWEKVLVGGKRNLVVFMTAW